MEYKINRILHSGTKGIRGIERTDGRYPMGIGRTVDLNLDDIQNGYPMILNYIKNADGSDYSNMYLRTSCVSTIIKMPRTVTIETLNSIFEFEKI